MGIMNQSDFQDLSDCEEHEALESASQLMSKAESTLVTLESFKARLAESGKIDKTNANTLRTLTLGLESLDVHFSKYPVNSYTTIPSETNVKATMEGLLADIGNGIVKVIKAIYAFIKKAIKALFSLRLNNKDKFSKLQDKVKQLKKRFPASSSLENVNSVNPKLAGYLVSLNNDAFARWLGGVGDGGELVQGGNQGTISKALFYLENRLVENIHAYIGYHKKVLLKYLDGVDGDADLSFAEYTLNISLQQKLAAINEIDQLFFGREYRYQDDPHKPLNGGEHALSRLTAVLDKISKCKHDKGELIVSDSQFLAWRAAVLNNDSLTDDKSTVNSNVYKEIERMIVDIESVVEKTIQEDKRADVQKSLLKLTKNIRDYYQCMAVYESILIQYRQSASLAFQGIIVSH